MAWYQRLLETLVNNHNEQADSTWTHWSALSLRLPDIMTLLTHAVEVSDTVYKAPLPKTSNLDLRASQSKHQVYKK